MHRPVGRYRHLNRRNLLTYFNITRRLLHIHFRLRTSHCLCKINCLGLGLVISGVSATSFNDVMDLLCFERRLWPMG